MMNAGDRARSLDTPTPVSGSASSAQSRGPRALRTIRRSIPVCHAAAGRRGFSCLLDFGPRRIEQVIAQAVYARRNCGDAAVAFET